MASAAPQPLVLPPKLGELYACLDGKGDVDILDIHAAMNASGEEKPLRVAQQYLGPYITKLNRRLRKHRQVVKPGRLKGTYALLPL